MIRNIVLGLVGIITTVFAILSACIPFVVLYLLWILVKHFIG